MPRRRLGPGRFIARARLGQGVPALCLTLTFPRGTATENVTAALRSMINAGLFSEGDVRVAKRDAAGFPRVKICGGEITSLDTLSGGGTLDLAELVDEIGSAARIGRGTVRHGLECDC